MCVCVCLSTCMCLHRPGSAELGSCCRFPSVVLEDACAGKFHHSSWREGELVLNWRHLVRVFPGKEKG
uniref:Putative secreted protein n=1 Tax=Anopheles darlingi TaxID=43151 RepID=A0A2M4DKS2_ANODA